MTPLVSVVEKEHHIAGNAQLLLKHAPAPRDRAWRLPGTALRVKCIQRAAGDCFPMAIVVALRPCIALLGLALPSLRAKVITQV